MDSNSSITRAEIQAMIDVQTKSVEQLTIIAKSLQDISVREEKIHERLHNGLGKEITEGICKTITECNAGRIKDIEEMKKIAEGVKSDTNFLKWLYGGLFGLVALAWLIVEVVKHVTKS